MLSEIKGSSVTMIDNLKIIERIVQSLKIRAQVYLDLGCGDGSLTLWIASLVKAQRIIGIDIDPEVLREAKRKGIETYCCDLNRDPLPLPESSVDLVTAFELLEHLWNKDFLLEEVYRVLKPGGFFILSTPNLASWVNRLLLLLGYLPIHYDVSLKYELQKRPFQRCKVHYGHINLYTLSALVSHLKIIGFNIVKVKGLLSGWSYKNKLVLYLSKLLSKRASLAPILLVVARKPR